MRTYSIGAMLLDIEDPTRIVGRLCEPLLSPAPNEQSVSLHKTEPELVVRMSTASPPLREKTNAARTRPRT